MATLVPPPTKRQRIEASEKAKRWTEESQIPSGLGSVRVQFVDQSTDRATGPAVAVPVSDATTQNLESLLNSIQGNVGIKKSMNYYSMQAVRSTADDWRT